MKHLFFLFLLSFGLQGQTIPNSEFSWDKPTHNVCRSEITGKNIHLSPKINPLITEMHKKEFTKLMAESVAKLSDTISCVMKLNIIFEKPYSLRVDRIGTKGTKLNNDQLEIFRQPIQTITKYNLGSTIGPKQNTIGIIYIYIHKGKLTKIRYIDMDFLT